MITPALTFGFIVATLLGSIFHLIVGGDTRRYALFLIAAWFGFAMGHFLGVVFQINIINIGLIRAFTAFWGAFAALFVAMILSSNRQRKRKAR